MSEPGRDNTENMRVYGRGRRWPLLAALGVVIPLTVAMIALAPNPMDLVPDQERGSAERTDETTGQEPEATGSGEAGEATADQEEREEQPAPEEEESTPPSSNEMSLTVPKLGLYGDTVRNSADPEVLHEGAQKLPSTGFPWQEGANTYIAGHRIGYPGTESYNQFYNLPAMREGDAVSLTDADGTEYDYEVTEIFAVSPSETWVTEPVAGKDVVTLQTCTHSVDDWWSITPQLFEAGPETGRLVVRAERV